MIFTNDKAHGGAFGSQLTSRLQSAKDLTIATGYFGTSAIKDLEPKLMAVSKKGRCRILFGMVFHGGVSVKQKAAIERLDKKLRATAPDNGVYISRKEYHGKIYHVDDEVYLGSSNLSEYGLKSRWECTAKIEDGATQRETVNYLDFLFSQETTMSLSSVALGVKRSVKALKPSRFLKDYKVATLPAGAVIDQMDIKLRVDSQPASSLNLYFDNGRKNQKGLYAPRPWYEVEITALAKDTRNPCYPKSKLKKNSKKSRQGSFFAHIVEKGVVYKLDMKIASDYGKGIMTSRACGGRETLGRYIKGKLEDSGALKRGERITSDTLEDYGRDFIMLKKIDNKNYILEF